MPSALSTRLKAWFVVATVVLIGSFGVRFLTFESVFHATQEAAKSRELLRQLEAVLATLAQAEIGERDYLITGDSSYLEPYRDGKEQLGEQLARLSALIGDNAPQRERLERLDKIIDLRLAQLAASIDRRDQEGYEAARASVEDDRARALLNSAAGIADAMIAEEQLGLDKKQRQVRTTERFNLINFFGLAGFNLLLMAALFNAVRREANKRLEIADVLRRHELRLRRVVESNVIGILFTDAAGIAIDANDALLELVGYDRSDLASGKLRRETITPPEYFSQDQRALAEACRTGTCAHYEKQYVRKDGTRLPVLVGIARIDDAATQFVAFVLDLSQRRQAEEARARLAAIVESSDDEIISKSLDGTIVTWNAGATRLFGYTAAEAVGRPNTILAPPERRDEDKNLVNRLINGERIEHFETERITKDGRRIDMALTTSLVRDATGMVIGVSTIGRDITARKRAEQERERLLAAEQAARAESERIGRVKDEFLATLSHELRTPLNAILGWTHLLISGELSPPEVAQGLEIIQRSARVQTQLIEDLLDMSRIISGKLRMDVQRVDLVTVVDAAIQSVRPAAEARQVRLEKVLDPAAGPVRGDPNRLQQIVWNLLANGVKFTPRGGRVQIALVRKDSHVEIIVSDTGQGIAADFLPHVFEQFRQADSSTTRHHSGLGLGLAIVRHLVESHGGSVSVASPGEGQGATFTVSLPLMIVHGTDDAAGSTGAGADGASAPDLKGVKVLVVDDEADARMLVRRLLEDRQATVCTAASAAEALTAIREHRPTVLLSDIGMPGADGYALIQNVRALAAADGGNLPAAALTACARSEDRRRALDSGFQMHLSKPVEPAELLSAVASLAGRKIAPSDWRTISHSGPAN